MDKQYYEEARWLKVYDECEYHYRQRRGRTFRGNCCGPGRL